MIFDIDGNELKVGDICTVITGPFDGTRVRITSIAPCGEPGCDLGCNCTANSGSCERYACSYLCLRKQKPDREDLQKVEWSTIHALGFYPSDATIRVGCFTITADGC